MAQSFNRKCQPLLLASLALATAACTTSPDAEVQDEGFISAHSYGTADHRVVQVAEENHPGIAD